MGMLWSQLSGGWEGTVTLNCNPSSRMTCSQASGGRPDGRVPSVCALALPPPMGGLPSSGPHSPAGREELGGGHAATATTTTVTEGTFPSHLELSKSRSRACKPGCRTLSGSPSPRTGPHRHMEGVCRADAVLGGSQKPHKTRAAMARFVSELLGSLLALRSTSAQGTAPAPRKLKVQVVRLLS